MTQGNGLREHDFWHCGYEIASARYADDKAMQQAMYSQWGMLDYDKQQAIHRAACGEWYNVDDVTIMAEFEEEAKAYADMLRGRAKTPEHAYGRVRA